MDPQQPQHGQPQQPGQQPYPGQYQQQPYRGQQYPQQPYQGGPQQWQQFPGGQPWPQQAAPPVRRTRRKGWIVGGSIGGVVLLLAVGLLILRIVHPEPQVIAQPPFTPLPTATTTPAPLPGAPTYCGTNKQGIDACFPVTAKAFETALPKQGYACAADDELENTTDCSKPKGIVNEDIEFEVLAGGIDTVRFDGTISGYTNVLKQTQADAWNNTLTAMNSMLPIVFPTSPSMRSAVRSWMAARHGSMAGMELLNPLPMFYEIGCTDGSPIDISGAHGTFRTYTYTCSLSILAH
jgi:hypothetical protein